MTAAERWWTADRACTLSALLCAATGAGLAQSSMPYYYPAGLMLACTALIALIGIRAVLTIPRAQDASENPGNQANPANLANPAKPDGTGM